MTHGGLNTAITVFAPTDIRWNRFRVREGGRLEIRFEGGAGSMARTVHTLTNDSEAVVAGAIASPKGDFTLIAAGGIRVDPTGSIEAQRFLGSTLAEVDQKALLSDREVTFATTTPLPTRIAVNGTISALMGVTLVGQSVFVNGSVLAPQGDVTIGAGKKVTLTAPDRNGDVRIDSAERRSLVVNSGTIEGARITIRVDGPRGPVDAAVVNQGAIRASGDVTIDAGPEPNAVIVNETEADPVIEGRRVVLRGLLQGAAARVFGPVDGSNPTGVSATRQFLGTTGSSLRSQLQPIQLSATQTETKRVRDARLSRPIEEKKKKAAMRVASTARSGTASPKPGKKAFYRYRSFFKTRRSQ